MSALVPCTNPRCKASSHVPGSDAQAQCQGVLSSVGTFPSLAAAGAVSSAAHSPQLAQMIAGAGDFPAADEVRRTLTDGADGLTDSDQDKVDQHSLEASQWLSSLTKEEWEAVNKYAVTANYAINECLRRGRSMPDATTDRLDEALAKTPDQHQRVLYRGMALNQNAERWIEAWLEVGQQVTSPEYLSTSEDPGVAVQFARDGEAVIFEILTDQGAPLVSQVGINEMERLLPRGMTFEVVGIRDDIEYEMDGSEETFPVVQLRQV